MKSKTFLLACSLALASIACQTAALAGPPSSADEEALTKIEQEWGQAYVKRDSAFVQRLTTDDFTMIEPDGNIKTKPAYLKGITGDTVFTEFKIEDLNIRTYGDTGIVVGTASIKANQGKQDVSGKYCFTDVFVRQNGEWKAVSGHVTGLPQGQSVH